MKSITYGLFATIALASPGLAQNAAPPLNPAIEQVRGSTQALTPETRADLRMISEDRGEVVELNGRPGRSPRFRLGASTSIEHQSNAALLPSGPRDDWASTSFFDAGWNPALSESLSFDLSLRSEITGYFHLDQLSYWGPMTSALFDFHPRANWPHAYAGGQLYRYDRIRSGAEITSAGAVLAGLEQSWDFHSGRTRLSIGYQFANYWAFPLSEDRMTHTLFVAITRQLAGSLYAQGSYTWQYTAFENQARYDSRHNIALALLYALNDRTALRLYMNFVRNESSAPPADYENFSSGLGVSFSAHF